MSNNNPSFLCPFSGELWSIAPSYPGEYKVSGTLAKAPHPLLNSSFRELLRLQYKIPQHLIIIRGLMELGVIFQHSLDCSMATGLAVSNIPAECVNALKRDFDEIKLAGNECPRFVVSAGVNLANVRDWLTACNYRLAELQPEKRRGMSALYLASIPTNKGLELIRANAASSQALTRRMWHNKQERPLLLELAGLEESELFKINATAELVAAVECKNWLRWHVLHFVKEEQNRQVEAINTVAEKSTGTSLDELLAARKARLVAGTSGTSGTGGV